jgi:5-methylcytosine-specific restriction enzyme subunit McrC
MTQSPPDVVELREWELTPNVLLTRAQVHALRTLFKALVQPSPDVHADRFDVRPGNLIGSVGVDGATVTVRPKIDINRVLFMIAYAHDPYRWESDWSALKGVQSLVDGVAELFVRTCERVLDRGLLRGYRKHNADLRVVRGRIDFARQLKQRPGHDLPLSVRFTVYDEDIPENQLLAGAARLVAGMPLTSQAVRSRLRRVTRDLGSAQPASPRTRLPQIRWTRTNEYYRPAVQLAELILRQRMLELAGGSTTVPGFVVPLYAVFEEFVRRALRESAGLADTAFPKPNSPLHLAERSMIPMKPDLRWVEGSRWRFVGDVKYKRDSGPGKDTDLYQVLAYAVASDLSSAALIYADGPPDAPSHAVRHIGRQLHLHHVDLRQEPHEVLDELARVAATHHLGKSNLVHE